MPGLGTPTGDYYNQPQLIDGVERRAQWNPAGTGITGYNYWFDGKPYQSADEANNQARTARQTAQTPRLNTGSQLSVTNTSPYMGGTYPSASSMGSGGGGGVGGGTDGGNVYVSPNSSTDPNLSGGPLISQNEYERERQMTAQADLGKQSMQDRLTAIRQLQNNFASSANGSFNPNSGGVAFDEQAARDAAFARAKDQAGSSAASAIKALQNLYANQGLTGSTVEGSAIGGQVGNALAGVNDMTREQYIQSLMRAAQISDRNYAGGLTARGQDMNYQQALMGLMGGGGYLY